MHEAGKELQERKEREKNLFASCNRKLHAISPVKWRGLAANLILSFKFIMTSYQRRKLIRIITMKIYMDKTKRS